MGLVDYGSDSEEDLDQPPKEEQPRDQNRTGPDGPKKRRKVLPSLPKSFDTSANLDNPLLHQGRSRSRPFVSGEYNAHVFIDLELPKAFDEVLLEITDLARSLCPNNVIHSLLRAPMGTSPLGEETKESLSEAHPKQPLHISLTHPLPLRRDQIKTFKNDLTARLRAHTSQSPDRGKADLQLSFAGQITGYVNGRRHGGEGSGGRAFLAVRVAAGAKQLEGIVEDAMHPLLDKLHLPRYHSNPEFHASFAWCLLDPAADPAGTTITEFDDLEDLDSTSNEKVNSSPFSTSILQKLNDAFGDRLMRAQPSAGWKVNHLELKIAKDIHHIPL